MPGDGLSRSHSAARAAAKASPPTSSSFKGRRVAQRSSSGSSSARRSASSRKRAASRDFPAKAISSSAVAKTAAAGTRFDPTVRRPASTVSSEYGPAPADSPAAQSRTAA